jgi:phage baseplate assembly protein gpV
MNERIIQIGVVVALSGMKAKVTFPATSITSDWLSVIDRGDEWAPEIGNSVLVIFVPVGDSDGFILGGIS